LNRGILKTLEPSVALNERFWEGRKADRDPTKSDTLLGVSLFPKNDYEELHKKSIKFPCKCVLVAQKAHHLFTKRSACAILAALAYFCSFECFSIPQTKRAKEIWAHAIPVSPIPVVQKPVDQQAKLGRMATIIEELWYVILSNCSQPGTTAAAIVFSSPEEIAKKMQDAPDVCFLVESEIKRLQKIFSEQIEIIRQRGYSLLSLECQNDATAQKILQDMLSPRVLDIEPDFFRRLLSAAKEGKSITWSEIEKLKSKVDKAVQKVPIFQN
jgi:hypothetical protein